MRTLIAFLKFLIAVALVLWAFHAGAQNVDVQRPATICKWSPGKPGKWGDCQVIDSTRLENAETWRDSVQVRGRFVHKLDTVQVRVTPYRLSLLSPRRCKRDGEPAFHLKEFRPCQ